MKKIEAVESFISNTNDLLKERLPGINEGIDKEVEELESSRVVSEQNVDDDTYASIQNDRIDRIQHALTNSKKILNAAPGFLDFCKLVVKLIKELADEE